MNTLEKLTEEKRHIIDHFLMHCLDMSPEDMEKHSFMMELGINIIQNPDHMVRLLENAYSEHHADDVERILALSYIFEILDENFVDILCRLLESDWHYRHESVASALQLLAPPEAADCLYRTAIRPPYEYLEYSDVYPLSVKCIWALGDINTKKSREKLKLLEKSDNEIIREKAWRQLNVYNLERPCPES